MEVTTNDHELWSRNGRIKTAKVGKLSTRAPTGFGGYDSFGTNFHDEMQAAIGRIQLTRVVPQAAC